jgi:hypothetical protein
VRSNDEILKGTHYELQKDVYVSNKRRGGEKEPPFCSNWKRLSDDLVIENILIINDARVVFSIYSIEIVDIS